MIEHINGEFGCGHFHDDCEHLHHHDHCHNNHEHFLMNTAIENILDVYEMLLTHVSRKSIHTSKEEILKLIDDQIKEALDSIDCDEFMKEGDVEDIIKRWYAEKGPFVKDDDNFRKLLNGFITSAELIEQINSYLNNRNYLTSADLEGIKSWANSMFLTKGQLPTDQHTYVQSLTLNDKTLTLTQTGTKSGTVSVDLSSLGGGSGTGGNSYVLTPATAAALGGIKVGGHKVGNNYPVWLDANNDAFVTVEGGISGGSEYKLDSVLTTGYPIAKFYKDGKLQETIYIPTPSVNPPTGDVEGGTVVDSELKTIYTSVNFGTPDTPTGGYISDWVTKELLDVPASWSVVEPPYEVGKYRYSSYRLFKSNVYSDVNENDVKWSAPSPLFTSSEANTMVSNNNSSYGVSLWTVATPDSVPEKPAERNYSSGTNPSTKYPEFDWDSKVLTWTNVTGLRNADKWFTSITDAQTAYLTNGGKLSDAKAYRIYSNYIEQIDGSGTLIDRSKTTWTFPVPFVDIDGILAQADLNSEEIAEKAISDATGDLNSAANSIQSLFDWKEHEYVPGADVLIDKPSGVTSLADLKNQCTGKDYYNKVVQIGSTYYKYECDITELSSKVDAIEGELGEGIGVTAIEQNADLIRLQASKGRLDYVTWTPITEAQYGATSYDKKNEKQSLPTSDVKYGDVYKVRYNIDGDSKPGEYFYYRADVPFTSTGFINVLSDNINFGVAKDTNNAATFNMKFEVNGNSIIEEKADQIVLDGDVIAASLNTKYLNVDNRTYLFGSKSSSNKVTDTIYNDVLTKFVKERLGSVILGQLKPGVTYPLAWFGAGTDGMTAFYENGSGYLAGGLVLWGSTSGEGNVDGFRVNVKGRIEALAGIIGEGSSAWKIGTYNGEGSIYSEVKPDGYTTPTKSIYISPSVIESKQSGTSSWKLQNDGSGMLARGNVSWNTAGDVSVTGNITANSFAANATNMSSSEITNSSAGMLWITNYASAKAISGGVIQNASVQLLDSDPVILFKQVKDGKTSFFVLNPSLLSDGENIKVTQFFKYADETTVKPTYNTVNKYQNGYIADKYLYAIKSGNKVYICKNTNLDSKLSPGTHYFIGGPKVPRSILCGEQYPNATTGREEVYTSNPMTISNSNSAGGQGFLVPETFLNAYGSSTDVMDAILDAPMTFGRRYLGFDSLTGGNYDHHDRPVSTDYIIVNNIQYKPYKPSQGSIPDEGYSENYSGYSYKLNAANYTFWHRAMIKITVNNDYSFEIDENVYYICGFFSNYHGSQNTGVGDPGGADWGFEGGDFDWSSSIKDSNPDLSTSISVDYTPEKIEALYGTPSYPGNIDKGY